MHVTHKVHNIKAWLGFFFSQGLRSTLFFIEIYDQPLLWSATILFGDLWSTPLKHWVYESSLSLFLNLQPHLYLKIVKTLRRSILCLFNNYKRTLLIVIYLLKRTFYFDSILNKKQDPGAKVKSDVERLWKIRCSLYKKERWENWCDCGNSLISCTSQIITYTLETKNYWHSRY